MHDLILNKQFEKLAWASNPINPYQNTNTGNDRYDNMNNTVGAGFAMGGTAGLWHGMRPSVMRRNYARGSRGLNLFGRQVLGRAKPGMVGKALGGLRGAGNVLLRGGLNVGAMGAAGALLAGGVMMASNAYDKKYPSQAMRKRDHSVNNTRSIWGEGNTGRDYNWQASARRPAKAIHGRPVGPRRYPGSSIWAARAKGDSGGTWRYQ